MKDKINITILKILSNKSISSNTVYNNQYNLKFHKQNNLKYCNKQFNNKFHYQMTDCL